MFGRRAALALMAAVAVSACTSIRVTGFVTDESTGEPVGGCGITFGQFYTNSDAAGHFVIKGRKDWGEMRFLAAGYEQKSVAVDASETRYPVIRVQLTPKAKAGQAPAAAPPK